MTTISAKTILRSRNTSGPTSPYGGKPNDVVSTILCRYPRWIHAEQRTHRLIPLLEGEEDMWAPSTPSLMADANLSRNAASSRAIPVKKLIQDVVDDPAVPLFWGKNQKGMQAGEEFVGAERQALIDQWLRDRDAAIERALWYEERGVHKQIVNRILEPYSHIMVLISATEWDNFLELRDHADAEPHIAMLAREIRKCLEDESTIQDLKPGAWHLPFVTGEELAGIDELHRLEVGIRLSTARCASTSYKTVDGFEMTVERAYALHDKLVSSRPIHASPAEHVCQADEWGEFWVDGYRHPEQHGNFRGFRQYRHMLEAAA